MGGFWGYGPHYHGGCLGSLIGAALMPVLLAIVLVVLVISLVVSSVSELSQGGTVRYDEQAFQAYADQQYAKIFADTAYEDNILLVVLTADDANDYQYIAWVGDHVDDEINALFGDDQTYLGTAMSNSISDTDYTYSLDSDLGRVVKAMAQKIGTLELESSLTCQEENTNAPSRLYNYTDLPLTEATVNDALAQFTENTGITLCIVVADMDTVFERGLSTGTVVLLVIVAIVAILLVVTLVKRRRQKQAPETADSREKRYKDPY